MQTVTKPGFAIGNFIEVFITNLFSRLIGSLMRAIVITYGLLLVAILILIGLIPVLIWLLIPFITYPIYIGKEKPLLTQLATNVIKTAKEMQKFLIKIFNNKQSKFIASRLELSNENIISILNNESNLKYWNIFRKAIKTQFKSCANFYQFIFQTHPQLGQYLDLKNLKSDDVYQAAYWYERTTSEKDGLLIMNLEKIQSLAGIGSDWAYGYTVELDKFSTDMTKRRVPYPFLVGREKEIQAIEQILSKNEENNVVVVGEPGVARHLLITTLAHRLTTGNCLKGLAHKRILALNMQSLISAYPTIAEVKGLASEIIEEAHQAGNIIIYIDEIDRYLATGEGRYDLSDIFTKMSQDSISVIGITTVFNYHKYIEQNPSLKKQFEKIEVTAPSKSVLTLELELSIVPELEKKHGVVITLPVLKKVIEDADRYISSTPFPAKAIELLDETIVFVKSHKKGGILKAQHVDEFLSAKLQIPIGSIDKSEKEKLAHLEDRLHTRIINQDEAVRSLSSSLRRARLSIAASNHPVGSFLFLGPTGVGKTETAKALADIYFGNKTELIRFDMSQYQNNEGMTRLIGSVSSGLPGELTTAILDNPFAVLLLDEFEKADQALHNLFLTVFDEGYLSDAHGKKIDTKNAIIIATSNAGSQFIREAVAAGKGGDILQKEIIKYVLQQKIFSPELINRFDGVIVFAPLSEGHLREIAKIMLSDLNNRLTGRGILVKITAELVNSLAAAGLDQNFGGRAMKRLIAEKVEDLVAQRLLSGTVKKGEEIEITI